MTPDNTPIPHYIAREADLRLEGGFNQYARQIAQLATIEKVGIDFEAALNPGPTPEEAASRRWLGDDNGDPLIGAVHFELRIEALGRSITHSMRAVYLLSLLDEQEQREDLYFKEGFAEIEALLWEDQEKIGRDGAPVRMSAPEWRPLDQWPRGFIPHAIQIEAEELTSVAALAQAARRKPKT